MQGVHWPALRVATRTDPRLSAQYRCITHLFPTRARVSGGDQLCNMERRQKSNFEEKWISIRYNMAIVPTKQQCVTRNCARHAAHAHTHQVAALHPLQSLCFRAGLKVNNPHGRNVHLRAWNGIGVEGKSERELRQKRPRVVTKYRNNSRGRSVSLRREVQVAFSIDISVGYREHVFLKKRRTRRRDERHRH